MRQPVVSSKCAEGELLYPGSFRALDPVGRLWSFAISNLLGDNAGDWVCDCRPTYVYYPLTVRCYKAFSQGPCKQNEILVLPKSKSIPVCERNTCDAGKVKFNNKCATLESSDVCKQPSKDRVTHRLYVSATNLQLECSFSTESRGSELIDEEEGIYESNDCFTGGKRAQENSCPVKTE